MSCQTMYRTESGQREKERIQINIFLRKKSKFGGKERRSNVNLYICLQNQVRKRRNKTNYVVKDNKVCAG